MSTIQKDLKSQVKKKPRLWPQLQIHLQYMYLWYTPLSNIIGRWLYHPMLPIYWCNQYGLINCIIGQISMYRIAVHQGWNKVETRFVKCVWVTQITEGNWIMGYYKLWRMCRDIKFQDKVCFMSWHEKLSIMHSAFSKRLTR